MAFRILSQMEETRKKKENYLNLKGSYNTLIILGCFTILACIFFTLLGIASNDTGTVTTTETTTSDSVYNYVCFGIFALMGVIGLVMEISGSVRRVRFNRELQLKESEYQLNQSRILSLLDANPIPNEINTEAIAMNAGQIVAPAPRALVRQKSSTKVLIVVGVAVVGMVFLCGLAAIALTIGFYGRVSAERAPINTLLDEFMKSMEAEDISRAFDLFSPATQRSMYPNDLTKMIQVGDKILFEGYVGISADNITLRAVANTNPSLPQGQVADVTGRIYYQDGTVRSFSASLEKVDGEWRISGITINGPIKESQQGVSSSANKEN